MNFIDFINEYWYILLIGIPLLLMYINYSKNKTMLGLNNSDLGLTIELGLYFLLIITIQDVLFNEHFYLIISMPIFIIVWSLFIYWLLSRDDIYILECTMQGEQFKNIKEIKNEISLTTRMRILIMSKEAYETKEHIGEANPSFWNMGHNIKLCDFYDGKYFYHPEFEQIHNLTFPACKTLWLKLKQDIPDLIRTNTTYTELMNYLLAEKEQIMRKNLITHLSAIEKQHDFAPFQLPPTMDELYKLIENQKNIALKESEQSDNMKKEKVIPQEVNINE